MAWAERFDACRRCVSACAPRPVRVGSLVDSGLGPIDSQSLPSCRWTPMRCRARWGSGRGLSIPALKRDNKRLDLFYRQHVMEMKPGLPGGHRQSRGPGSRPAELRCPCARPRPPRANRADIAAARQPRPFDPTADGWRGTEPRPHPGQRRFRVRAGVQRSPGEYVRGRGGGGTGQRPLWR